MKPSVWLSMLFLLTALAAFSAWRTHAAHVGEVGRESRGESAVAILRELERDLRSIEREGDRVVVVSRGRFAPVHARDAGDWRAPIRFVLAPGDRFRRAPDHHVGWELRVDRIDSDGVRLSYLHQYSHPGDRGRGSDRGEVTLSYRADDAPQ